MRVHIFIPKTPVGEDPHGYGKKTSPPAPHWKIRNGHSIKLCGRVGGEGGDGRHRVRKEDHISMSSSAPCFNMAPKKTKQNMKIV